MGNAGRIGRCAPTATCASPRQTLRLRDEERQELHAGGPPRRARADRRPPRHARRARRTSCRPTRSSSAPRSTGSWPASRAARARASPRRPPPARRGVERGGRAAPAAGRNRLPARVRAASTTSASPSPSSTPALDAVARRLRLDVVHREVVRSRASRPCCSPPARATSSCSRRSAPTRPSAFLASAARACTTSPTRSPDIDAALAALRERGRAADRRAAARRHRAARASPSCTRDATGRRADRARRAGARWRTDDRLRRAHRVGFRAARCSRCASRDDSSTRSTEALGRRARLARARRSRTGPCASTSPRSPTCASSPTSRASASAPDRGRPAVDSVDLALLRVARTRGHTPARERAVARFSRARPARGGLARVRRRRRRSLDAARAAARAGARRPRRWPAPTLANTAIKLARAPPAPRSWPACRR